MRRTAIPIRDEAPAGEPHGARGRSMVAARSLVLEALLQPIRTYRPSPTFVRMLRSAEAATVAWLGLDPLLVRTIASDMRLRIAART